MKSDDNLMNPVERLRNAPRCSATAKASGERCKCPAVGGWNVCRVHGARGGAPKGSRHGMWKHGGRSREAITLRALVAELQRLALKISKARPENPQ